MATGEGPGRAPAGSQSKRRAAKSWGCWIQALMMLVIVWVSQDIADRIQRVLGDRGYADLANSQVVNLILMLPFAVIAGIGAGYLQRSIERRRQRQEVSSDDQAMND